MPGGSRERADVMLMSALATGKPVSLAATEAGVSRRTAFRRLASPVFRRQLERVQSKVMDASVGVLSHALRTASERLVELLNTGSEKMQLRAAQAILSQMTAVRMAILADMQACQGSTANSRQEPEFNQHDEPAGTVPPSATACQSSDRRGSPDNQCQPSRASIRQESDSNQQDEPAETVPPSATACQSSDRRGSPDKQCQPLRASIRQESESSRQDKPAETVPPTATECQSGDLRSRVPAGPGSSANRRQGGVKVPRVGWRIALPMAFR
jgi:hypothetical protein